MADRMVNCAKLGKELPGLDRPPFKGALGQRLFENVSKQAWQMWIAHSVMLMNEYRLDTTSPAHQQTWFRECEKFFFGEGSALPPDFKPQTAGDAGKAAGDAGKDAPNTGKDAPDTGTDAGKKEPGDKSG